LVWAVGDGFVPAVVEGLEEAVFDFGGDVGVGLLDTVAQDVTQPSGLGDFGDAVGDHPGLVAMTQSMEGQPGFDRFQPHRRRGQVPGSFGGRAQRAASEVAAPVRFPAMGGEHVWMVVADAVREIGAAADKRDAASDDRDVAAGKRENDLDRAEMLDPESKYGTHWPERRNAGLDRGHAKDDRTASHDDRIALTEGDVEHDTDGT
jgi:hypothetical protein